MFYESVGIVVLTFVKNTVANESHNRLTLFWKTHLAHKYKKELYDTDFYHHQNLAVISWKPQSNSPGG